MKNIESLSSSHGKVSETQLALRALVVRSIIVKLEQAEHTKEAVQGIKGAIRAANTSLSKGLLPDEIIEKLEYLLVSTSQLHQACHMDYRHILQSVKDKGIYSKWKPQTLKILNSNSAAIGAMPLVFNPAIDHKTAMGIYLVTSRSQVKQVYIPEIKLLLNDLKRLNQANPAILQLTEDDGIVCQCYERVTEASHNDSIIFRQGNPIGKWNKKNVSSWAGFIKANPQIARDVKMLPEMIAVISQAVLLTTEYLPRDVQILSVIMMNIGGNRGLLMQIATGEGKSTTTAMVAVVNALKGRKVDIVTSSSVLATRDAEEWQNFYNIFNIASNHNITQGYVRGPKDCYTKDIVYGDTLHFQSDLLRDEHKLMGTRNGRSFSNSVVLIDEVDSMLIDESGKIAKLATPVASMEYLAPIFVASFSYLQQLVNYFNEEASKGGADLTSSMSWIQENLTHYIEKLVGISSELDSVEQIIVPRHLQDFVEQQAQVWAKSAVQALTMSEKRDYLVIELDGQKVIAPVDYASTGVVQAKTNWMNGLHQFLQIKHNLAMTPESLTTSFISNMAYFMRYGERIFGMSGTLGSKSEQELLQRVYNVDLGFIPTFKPKRFTELPGIVADSTNLWQRSIIESVNGQISARRAVLILAETIDDVEKIEKVLIESGLNPQKIHTYTTGSERETRDVLANKAMIGDIIVATNIAGRGTDIKTSKAVEAAGGLHICLTFLPSNLRVEDQAFGRTARQGNPGTGQLIINGPYEALKLFKVLGDQESPEHLTDIEILKQRRNQAETFRIKDIEDRLLPKIKAEDQMFSAFSQLSHAMKKHEDSSYKLRQLEEHWGLWFKKVSSSSTEDHQSTNNHELMLRQFAEFSVEMESRYKDGYSIMHNHVYLTQEAVNKFGKHNSYNESIDLLGKATGLAGEYGFAAHYNRAYAFFRKNGENLKKNHMGYVQNGIEHLNTALMQLEGVIIPQLHMMQILIGEELNNSDLSMQVATKLNLHKLQSEYIRNALSKIEDGLSKEKIIVVNDGGTKPIFELLGQSHTNPSEEVLELSRFGTMHLFTLDARNPPQDTWGAIGMSVLGISQFVVGALVTVCSVGAATPLGVSMMMSGAQDLYKGVRVGMGKETINWNDYWINKGISYAISIVAMGWDNFKAGLQAVKDQVGKIAEASKNFLSSTASSVMGKQAATHIATSAVQEATTTSFTSIGLEFIAKQGMSRVAIEVGKSIALQNLTDVVAKEIAGSLSDTKEDVRDSAYARIMDTLTTDPTSRSLNQLITVDHVNGNNHYVLQVKKAANELLAPKIDMLTHLARKLSTAAITGMASRSPNIVASIATKVVVTGFEMTEAASQIKSLIGDFCDDLRVKISEIERNALITLPQIMHQRMSSSLLDKSDINAILEILKMNKVLRPDNMQFESDLLASAPSFEAGISFPTLPTPQVKNPVILAGALVNPPSFQEVKAFQLEDLRHKSANEAKNIEAIDFGPYRKYRAVIIKNVRELNKLQIADYSQEKTQIATELAGKVTDRTMGIIRRSIIAPVAGATINFSAEKLTEHFERFRMVDDGTTGLSAGDEAPKTLFDKLKERKKERERAKERELEEDIASKSKPSKDTHSREMFGNRGGKGSEVLDRLIGNVFSVFDKKYEESLKESKRQEGVSSLELFESRNREINQNVVAIRRGQGHVSFKTAAEFNETFGGSLRYLFDQSSHTAHIVSPEVTGLLNATTGTLGHGVSELFQLTLPDSAKEYLAVTYKEMMGHFPTENQKFAVELPVGVLLGKVTAEGLSVAVVNRGSNAGTSALIRPSLSRLAEAKPVHKNSHQYVGKTLVYRILDSDGKTYKIGESAQGVRKKDGASIRAEQQARKLRYETGERYETEVRRTFSTKKEAYEYENKLIKKFREVQGKDTLPGNKGDH